MDCEKNRDKKRHFLSDNQLFSDICIQAAEEALANADIKASELDAVIVVTVSADYRLNSTALIVKDALGADQAFTLDISHAGCSAAIYGLVTSLHFIQNPEIKNILLICGDAISRILNPEDRTSCVFFGDAAGAFVLRSVDYGGILEYDLGSSLSFAVQVPHNETYLQMDGKEVWKRATEVLPKTIRNSLGKLKLVPEDIDFYVQHQANINIIKETLKRLEVDENKTHINIDKYGNTSAGTIPSVLHESVIEGKNKDGDLIVIAGIGAGFNWGSIVMKY